MFLISLLLIQTIYEKFKITTFLHFALNLTTYSVDSLQKVRILQIYIVRLYHTVSEIVFCVMNHNGTPYYAVLQNFLKVFRVISTILPEIKM